MPEPLTPGPDTSEFRSQRLGLIIGAVLQVLAVVLNVLPTIAPDAKWLPGALALGGTILQAASIFGYQVSRGIAKSGQGGAPTPPPPGITGGTFPALLVLALPLLLLGGCVLHQRDPKTIANLEKIREQAREDSVFACQAVTRTARPQSPAEKAAVARDLADLSDRAQSREVFINAAIWRETQKPEKAP